EFFTSFAISDSLSLPQQSVLHFGSDLECFVRIAENLFELLLNNRTNDFADLIGPQLTHINSHTFSFHFTTSLTNLCGTTITFTTSRPSMKLCTLPSASAMVRRSASEMSGATMTRERSLPFTWTGISSSSLAASFGSAFGHT